jgi:hypothetical protein
LGELLDVALEVKKQTRGEHSNVYFQRRIRVDVPPLDHRGRLPQLPFGETFFESVLSNPSNQTYRS